MHAPNPGLIPDTTGLLCTILSMVLEVLSSDPGGPQNCRVWAAPYPWALPLDGQSGCANITGSRLGPLRTAWKAHFPQNDFLSSLSPSIWYVVSLLPLKIKSQNHSTHRKQYLMFLPLQSGPSGTTDFLINYSHNKPLNPSSHLQQDYGVLASLEEVKRGRKLVAQNWTVSWYSQIMSQYHSIPSCNRWVQAKEEAGAKRSSTRPQSE